MQCNNFCVSLSLQLENLLTYIIHLLLAKKDKNEKLCGGLRNVVHFCFLSAMKTPLNIIINIVW